MPSNQRRNSRAPGSPLQWYTLPVSTPSVTDQDLAPYHSKSAGRSSNDTGEVALTYLMR
jgi:hypothetical protein